VAEELDRGGCVPSDSCKSQCEALRVFAGRQVVDSEFGAEYIKEAAVAIEACDGLKPRRIGGKAVCGAGIENPFRD